MLDRGGNKIRVAFSEKEVIWLEAANTLDAYDRSQAFYDLAFMTGRMVNDIRTKANEMRRQTMELRAKAMAQATIWRLGATQLVASGRSGLGPSEIAAPTKAQLMGSR